MGRPAGDTRRTGARWPLVLAAATTTASLAVGIALVISGSAAHPPAAAPLPARPFTVAPGNAAAPARASAQPGARCSIPVTSAHLVIGSVCINALIVPTYQQNDGALIIPRDVHQVGMWNGGAQLTSGHGDPLNHGTTLLAGHINFAGQGEGALYNLSQIQPGAIAYASDGAGHVTVWRMASLAAVPQPELPSWVFAGRAGPRRLVIVTCGGPLDYIAGYGYTYRDNVIAVGVPALNSGRPVPLTRWLSPAGAGAAPEWTRWPRPAW